MLDVYADAGVDLVLTGHVHGGQFRIPGVGGILAPDQGFFPRYDAGVFRRRGTTMVISRGLGPSIIPVRLFNRPELVLVDVAAR
jgi:predicted MPP superfamily phosphohydrolase